MMKEMLRRRSQKGQSLVEMAFVLPILLFLAVGIVELGYALNAYIQTVNAAREGARFGSLGGSATGVLTVVQGATSGLVQYDETNSDLFVAHAELTGTAPNCQIKVEDEAPLFSCEQTLDTDKMDSTCMTSDELVSRLASDGLSSCDLKVVAVDLYYRSPSFLSLPLVKQLSEAVPMRSLTVMRMESPRPLLAVCNVYPIAVHRSVLAGKKRGDSLGDMYNGLTEGDFGWLRWPNDPSGGSAGALEDALTRPTSDQFENAVDPEDTHLSVGDWVWANSGLSNSSGARGALDNLMNKGWIRVVVWDESDGTGSNGMYRAANFVIIKLTGYHLPGQNMIQAEFVRYDSTGCVE
jgi:hypothetical protein